LTELINIQSSEFYDCIAGEYDNLIDQGPISLKIREYLRNSLMHTFKTGDHILDIGCGTGTDAIFFANKKVKVTAIDTSMKMIEKAKQKTTEMGLDENINFEILAAEEINKLNEHKFDAAYSNFDVLNHIKDLEKFSEDLFYLLKPGSKFILTMLNKTSISEFLTFLFNFKFKTAINKLISRQKTLEIYTRLYYPGEVKKIFSKNFKTTKIRSLAYYCLLTIYITEIS
jgi:ubiquinone biosynthesis O-methyltransferase